MEGKYWQSPRRPVIPKPLQKPHPPIWGATSSVDGHRMMGKLGVGLCSFTVGLPPEELGERVKVYREGVKECSKPLGKFPNHQAATFTMVNCAPTREESYAVSRESFEWYPKYGGRLIASLAAWQEERQDVDLANYEYTKDILKHDREGIIDQISFDYLKDSGSGIVGTPDDVVAACRRYEATGCDLLLCLMNPLKIPHAKVMQTIELMGRYVLPEFARTESVRPNASSA
jgi:alkanesulfonate monooxygenase SsuD/methylene tetrahydromethanopterin reductase-like flavin-dependent oxidoreductase (luciferase family)